MKSIHNLNRVVSVCAPTRAKIHAPARYLRARASQIKGVVVRCDGRGEANSISARVGRQASRGANSNRKQVKGRRLGARKSGVYHQIYQFAPTRTLTLTRPTRQRQLKLPSSRAQEGETSRRTNRLKGAAVWSNLLICHLYLFVGAFAQSAGSVRAPLVRLHCLVCAREKNARENEGEGEDEDGTRTLHWKAKARDRRTITTHTCHFGC